MSPESRDEPVSDLTIVAVVTEWPWPPRNGVTMKSGPLLAALGRRVHVVAPMVSGPVPAHVVAHPLAMPSRWRFELRRVAALFRMRIAGTAVVPEKGVLAEVRAVLDAGETVDVVHLDMPTTGHLVEPVRRLLSERGQHPPVVLSINDSYSLLAAVASPRRGLSRLAQLRNAMQFERRCLPRADVVDVVAPADERWLAREVPKAHVRVLPLARPELTPAPVDAERPTDVVIFATQVGLDDVLDQVLPEVRSRRPDLRVVMVGGSSDPSAVARVRALGGTSTGFVPDDVLDHHLTSAKVLVAPSQQESGTSNKAIRAMSLGAAVVGGRCLDGVPGLVDGVHALVGRDPAAITRALVDVLDDDVRRLELARSGQELALGLPTAAETAERYLAGLR